jgi:pimeloyl-ACP methyl ester carboxylesterase
MPDDLAEQINGLVAAGRDGEAAKLFFHKGMGIPAVFVTLMRWLMPRWSKTAAMAHTITYDLAVLAGTQTGKPLPAQRWASAAVPTLVAVGSKSEAFFHTGARALASLLPDTHYRSLEGRDHAAVMMAPKAVADAVKQFFLNQK